MKGVAALGAALSTVALGTGVAVGLQNRPSPLSGRAFDVSATAYPFEPAAGANASPELVRLVETTANASNPPVEADARAAASDLGQAEAYSDAYAQPPQASASTRNTGRADHKQMQAGGSDYVADANPAPRSAATASAALVSDSPVLHAGQVVSRSTADGSGPGLVATASSVVHDAVVGPVTIGLASYDATASAAGTPGSARAAGSVTVSNAVVAGVPVLITGTGIEVDQTKVPVAALAAATKGVHDALAQGGYLDVRVIQPQTATAADGSSAHVTGGGILFYGTNNDPTNYYFVRVTLLTGNVQAAIGSPLAQQVPSTGLLPPRAAQQPPSSASQGSVPKLPAPATRVVPSNTRVGVPRLQFAQASSSVGLPDVWSGWPWLLVAVGALGLATSSCWLPIGAPIRRRASRWTVAFADRYVRG